MMKQTKLLGLILPVCFGGCSIPPYITPNLPQSQLATVYFSNKAKDNAGLLIFTGENCTEQRTIKDGILTQYDTRTLKFEAGKPITFFMHYTTYNYSYPYIRSQSCKVIETFSPEAGTYFLDFSQNEMGCGFSATLATGGKTKTVPGYKFMRRTYNLPFFASGGFCR